MNEHNYELESKGLRLISEHILKVQGHMASVLSNLTNRMTVHDQSKFTEQELGLVMGKPSFDKYEYMSKEERQALESVKESLQHHYNNNSHHPEFYASGVNGMSLFDLIEMVCDWKAASEMSPNGSLEGSIEYNTERFNLSPEIVKILRNTGLEMGWIEPD